MRVCTITKTKILHSSISDFLSFASLQGCVSQIFDIREVNVVQNQQLADEFAINIRNIFIFLESRIGEHNEMGQRKDLMGLCGLFVLFFRLYSAVDKKLAKQVYDIYKKVSSRSNTMYFLLSMYTYCRLKFARAIVFSHECYLSHRIILCTAYVNTCTCSHRYITCMYVCIPVCTHTQIPAVHILGNLLWFHTDFMITNLPYMMKMIDHKQQQQVIAFREQFLLRRSQNITT